MKRKLQKLELQQLVLRRNYCKYRGETNCSDDYAVGLALVERNINDDKDEMKCIDEDMK